MSSLSPFLCSGMSLAVFHCSGILIKTTSKWDITNYQNTPKKLFDRSFKKFWLCTPNASQNMLNSRKKVKKERETIKLGANLSKKMCLHANAGRKM